LSGALVHFAELVREESHGDGRTRRVTLVSGSGTTQLESGGYPAVVALRQSGVKRVADPRGSYGAVELLRINLIAVADGQSLHQVTTVKLDRAPTLKSRRVAMCPALTFAVAAEAYKSFIYNELSKNVLPGIESESPSQSQVTRSRFGTPLPPSVSNRSAPASFPSLLRRSSLSLLLPFS
jgi:hypothetical protein